MHIHHSLHINFAVLFWPLHSKRRHWDVLRLRQRLRFTTDVWLWHLRRLGGAMHVINQLCVTLCLQFRSLRGQWFVLHQQQSLHIALLVHLRQLRVRWPPAWGIVRRVELVHAASAM